MNRHLVPALGVVCGTLLAISSVVVGSFPGPLLGFALAVGNGAMWVTIGTGRSSEKGDTT